MRKKRKIKIILTIFVLLSVIGGGLFLALRNGRYLRWTESLRRLVTSVSFQTEATATRSYSLEELAKDSRITWNQAGMLINQSHLLPDDFVPELVPYRDTKLSMNAAVCADFYQLGAAVREKFNEKLLVMSSYRSAEQQQQAMEKEGDKATVVGASEHQAGLGLDVYIMYHAGQGFLYTDVGQWVNKECWRYGFIIRYPAYGEAETGIAFEPWHLRYIGKPHAEIIYKNALTLEQYIQLLSDGAWHIFGDYRISRQQGQSIALPVDFVSATVSPDNDGGYLVTACCK